MGKSSPATPQDNSVQAAQVQGTANKDAAVQTALLSNPNITSPYGSSTNNLTVDPTTGDYVSNVTQTLNPQSQQIFDSQQQTRQGLADLSNTGVGIAQNTLGQQFNPSGPGVQTGLDTSNVAQAPVNGGQTGYNAMMSYLQPQMDRATTSEQTQLTNQGLRPGSQAYDAAMADLGTQQDTERSQAAAQGVNLDLTANNQGYNQALQSGQFANTAQQQSLSQQLQQRDLPLNEINALMSSSQIVNPQYPGYTGANVAAPNYQQAAQSSLANQTNAYNAQVGSNNATTSGLYGLGASALGAVAMI